MPTNPPSLQARRDAMVQEKMTELGLKYSCDMDPADWMSMCEEAKDACLSDLLRQLDELGRALAERDARIATAWRMALEAQVPIELPPPPRDELEVRELEEGDEALLAVLPEDFGAVEYIKSLESQLRESQLARLALEEWKLKLLYLHHDSVQAFKANDEAEALLINCKIHDILHEASLTFSNTSATAQETVERIEREALEAKLAESEAKVKELNAQINSLGDAATDTFEQMLMGNWQDDHGHPVLNNTAMLALKSAVNDVLEASKKGAEHGD